MRYRVIKQVVINGFGECRINQLVELAEGSYDAKLLLGMNAIEPFIDTNNQSEPVTAVSEEKAAVAVLLEKTKKKKK